MKVDEVVAEGVEVEVIADVVVEAVEEVGVVVEAVEVVEVAEEVVVVEAVEEVEVVGVVERDGLFNFFKCYAFFLEGPAVEEVPEVVDAVAVGFTRSTRRIYTWRSVF